MDNKKNNFIFWGTPEISVQTLEILKENGFLPSLIITNPDTPKGRGMKLSPSPVGLWAEKNNIPCLKPEKINHEEIWNILGTLGRHDGAEQRKFSAENFRGEQNIPDLFVVVAYGKILPEELINLPKLGTINIHYSLLPKYRGASPVEQALLNGDTETGVSIQKMKLKLDSGPIIANEKVSIEPTETKIDLLNKLVKVGGNLLVKTLPNLFEGKIKLKEQDESQATKCGKIKKEEGLLDLNDNPIKNYNKYRAFFGYPGTYFFDNGKRYKITKAKHENNSFIIERVIPENSKEIDFNILK